MNTLSDEALERLRLANMDCSTVGNDDERMRRQRAFQANLAARQAVATEVSLGDTITND